MWAPVHERPWLHPTPRPRAEAPPVRLTQHGAPATGSAGSHVGAVRTAGARRWPGAGGPPASISSQGCGARLYRRRASHQPAPPHAVRARTSPRSSVWRSPPSPPGTRRPKVFKLTTRSLQPGRPETVVRRHRFREVSVRRLYPGPHRIDVQVNGCALATRASPCTRSGNRMNGRLAAVPRRRCEALARQRVGQSYLPREAGGVEPAHRSAVSRYYQGSDTPM